MTALLLLNRSPSAECPTSRACNFEAQMLSLAWLMSCVGWNSKVAEAV